MHISIHIYEKILLKITPETQYIIQKTTNYIPHLGYPPVGVVEEDLEVLVEVSGVLCYLFLEQLQQAVESNLTEQVVRLLCGGAMQTVVM